jgi:hypothetical protein
MSWADTGFATSPTASTAGVCPYPARSASAPADHWQYREKES